MTSRTFRRAHGPRAFYGLTWWDRLVNWAHRNWPDVLGGIVMILALVALMMVEG